MKKNSLRDKLKKVSKSKGSSVSQELYERADKILVKCYRNAFCDCKRCKDEEVRQNDS